jgi:hypothetical protein
MDSVPLKPAAPGAFRAGLLSANVLTGRRFKEWVFHPGMLFGSDRKWWGGGGTRTTLHEGLDLCFFRDHSSEIRQLQPGAKVTAILEGTIAHICDDFLGKSIFVRHDSVAKEDKHLYTIYGHTRPNRGMHRLVRVGGGERIALIADTRAKGSTIPSHIHISVAWISDTIRPTTLDWEALGNRNGVALADPLSMLDLPYAVQDSIPLGRIGESNVTGQEGGPKAPRRTEGSSNRRGPESE